ncbi:glycogen synthase GlgA [Floricoccus penangensis]|uniref:glycogen synthase GlgA n=1 Tax=Floricoccus penangensis TaxID=1859475 RepID=UPI00203CC333|nr:glycogen synthase GlgA [Floricoccus penangensis]URZ87698.1 glycogen synthase GlgA [Floricoccus penangensis]
MKILLVGAEAAPFIKTGGLGDVLGALPKSLNKKKDVDARVILPYYKGIPQHFKDQAEDLFYTYVDVGWRHMYAGVKHIYFENVHFYFIDNEYYFNRDGVYGFYDDGERFAFFQQAVLEILPQLEFIPDVIHVNDYHTAMIPVLLREKYAWIDGYPYINTLLTIHNIEFQGQYDPATLGELFNLSMDKYNDGTFQQDGCFNWLKSGLIYANKITTVSPTYAKEIQTPEFGKGLDSILRAQSSKLSGIVNGIDTEIFDPAKDEFLFKNYSLKTVKDKTINKLELQKQVGLPVREDVMLVGIVSRLTYQKGFHLVLEQMKEILNWDIQFVILGTGYKEFEEGFSWFAENYPDQVATIINFNLELAQRIYGGSDLFLMPSAFEPCGLSQMMAMRYGNLPLVHEIGGLKDTVSPYNPLTGEGTGFGFKSFDSYWLKDVLASANLLYNRDQEAWKKLQKNAMEQDFSWDTASLEYLNLYWELN